VKQHGPWKICSTREVYKDPWIEVRKDDVIRPDGADGTHCVVNMKPGVSVLPLDNQGFVYLTEEFHYGVGRTTIETVSGGIDPGEDAPATAARELQEELGIRAALWTDLGMVDPFTSIVVSPTGLFLAQDLSFVDTSPEGTEQIRLVKVKLAQAVDWVISSKITHAPSCVLILKARHFLSEER
jgi:ADP-ribose pyrophosphatase